MGMVGCPSYSVGILNQLGDLFLSAVPTVIIVLLFYFFMRWSFFGPIQRVLSERHKRAEGARQGKLRLAERQYRRNFALITTPCARPGLIFSPSRKRSAGASWTSARPASAPRASQHNMTYSWRRNRWQRILKRHGRSSNNPAPHWRMKLRKRSLPAVHRARTRSRKGKRDEILAAIDFPRWRAGS